MTSAPADPEVERRVRELLTSRGDKIGAIKALREATGCSLKDAHTRVCAIAEELGLRDLAWKPSEAAVKATLFLLLAGVALLAFLAYRAAR